MSRLAQENVLAAVLLVIFGGVAWLCQDFGPRARLIPLPLAILGIVLTVMQILWQNLRSTDELQMDLVAVDEQPAENAVEAETGREPRGASWQRELRAYGMVVLLIALILIGGIVPAVFFFTAGYFVLTRQYSWLMSVVYAAVFTASVYLLFMTALQIQPYHGLLEPVIERLR